MMRAFALLGLASIACQPAAADCEVQGEACVAPPPQKGKLVREASDRPPGPTADTLCGFFQDRLEACELPPAARPACPARAIDLSPFRQDYLWRMALCLEGAPCSTFTGEALAWPNCHDVAVRMMPVTKPLRSFCYAASRRAAQCQRRGEVDQTACLSERRFLHDDAIAKAHACLAEDCAAIPACLQRTMGQPRGVR